MTSCLYRSLTLEKTEPGFLLRSNRNYLAVLHSGLSLESPFGPLRGPHGEGKVRPRAAPWRAKGHLARRRTFIRFSLAASTAPETAPPPPTTDTSVSIIVVVLVRSSSRALSRMRLPASFPRGPGQSTTPCPWRVRRGHRIPGI
jgi:hypothetical protein